MRYNLYTNNETNYITLMKSNEYKILTYDSYTKVLCLLRNNKPTRYIEVSDERVKKLIQKIARKILCTVQ